MQSSQSILLTTLNAKYIHLNLAIRLLYELNKSDERLHWKEFTIKDDLDFVAQECAKNQVVCLSCYIWNITQTLIIAPKIKALNADTKILLGGPEVSYEWQEIIELPYIDFIITGEGEIPFASFLKFYPEVNSIPNLVSKKGKEIQYHKDSIVYDLNHYQHTNPYHHDDTSSLQNRVLYIETSRGCPYKCEFCLASLDNKVRYLPMDHIKSNLLYLMRYGKVIKFLDRTFNVKKDFTLEIFQFILNHARPENVFQFEITADILHPEIMQFILEKVPKGMFRFEIGIQTVNQKANLEVSRKQNFEKTKQVILKLMSHVEMHLDLIVGLPLDYWEDIKFSFEEVFKIFAPELQLGFLKFLKGTPVREKHEKYGFQFDPIAPYQIIKSDFLSEQELADIVKMEHALEIYWNKKRIPNTLKYITQQYSVFDFLLELGKYFGKIKSYHDYTLNDIFTIVELFCKEHYPEDTILTELLAIDYYFYHKIKPGNKFINDLNKKDKHLLIESKNLQHQKFRYQIIPIHFNYEIFIKNNLIVQQLQLLIFEYSGVTKPQILNYN